MGGVYWKPVYNLCEGLFDVLVVNAQHVKAVPGRKTDVRDAEWIADLLQHGLLQPSFIPPAPQRELRELTRYRATLLRERAAEVNRIQKTLEGGNIKLAAVATDVLGVSGRAMLAALVAGTTDALTLARLARGRLRDKREDLERALSGRVGAHQRFLLAEQLCHVDALDESIARLSQEIAERLRPFEAELVRLQTIPGVGRRGAEVFLAEIGAEMSVSREYPPSVDGMAVAVPAGAVTGQDRPGSGSVQSRDGVWPGCCPHESARRASSDPPVMRGKAPRPSIGPRSAPDRETGSSARRAPAGGGYGSPA